MFFSSVSGNYPWSPILKKNPFRQGTIIQLRIKTPRKPNSARRQVLKLLLHPRSYTVSSLIGRGHTLKKHSHVLIKGGGSRDLPGVYTQAIRGKYDLKGVYTKKRRRSIYGISKKLQESLNIF
jgi:small subunit ribosomal protein S12